MVEQLMKLTSFAMSAQGTVTQGTICPTPPMSPFHAASPVGVTTGPPVGVGVGTASKFTSPQSVYITENGKNATFHRGSLRDVYRFPNIPEGA